MSRFIIGLGDGWESLGSVYRMGRGLLGQNPENLYEVEKKLANKKEWSEMY